MDVNAHYNGQDYQLIKNFVLPEFNFNAWGTKNGKNISIFVRSNYDIPSANAADSL